MSSIACYATCSRSISVLKAATASGDSPTALKEVERERETERETERERETETETDRQTDR